VSATPTPGEGSSSPDLPVRLGISAGMVVAEIGFDDDSDEEVSVSIENFLSADLVGADSDEVVDVVLLWFRETDGDLVDALVDAITPLADGGLVWLLTPRRGRAGYVEPSDIAEAAPTAGLSQTSLAAVGMNWTGVRLVPRRSRPERR
jgi:hypothetical protein